MKDIDETMKREDLGGEMQNLPERLQRVCKEYFPYEDDALASVAQVYLNTKESLQRDSKICEIAGTSKTRQQWFYEIATALLIVQSDEAKLSCKGRSVILNNVTKNKIKEVLEEEKATQQPEDKRAQARAALTDLFESIKTDKTPNFVKEVVNDIDTNVVDIVRKFKEAFKSVTAQREIKKKLRSILWVKYQIKDEDVFNKAYSYIEMYY